MRPTPLYILLLILAAAIFSCTMRDQQPAQTSVESDSAMIKAAKDLKNFDALLPYFSKDSITLKDSLGKIYLPIDFEKKPLKPFSESELVVKIPFDHLRDYMPERIDTLSEISYYPVTLIKNIHTYSFIIRVDCYAGGFCNGYYLLRFTAEGDFLEKQDLGMDAGEADESVYFGYMIENDSLLKTYEIHSYEEGNKPNDTLVKSIILK